MLNIFISIAVGLVIINIIYALLPDEGYNKYLKMVVGILLLVFIVNKISDIDLKNSFYEFETGYTEYENEEYQMTVRHQLEKTVSGKIADELNEKFQIEVKVECEVENAVITKITVNLENKIYEKEIIKFLRDTYNLDDERILII